MPYTAFSEVYLGRHVYAMSPHGVVWTSRDVYGYRISDENASTISHRWHWLSGMMPIWEFRLLCVYLRMGTVHLSVICNL